jgi:hypothetical protein
MRNIRYYIAAYPDFIAFCCKQPAVALCTEAKLKVIACNKMSCAELIIQMVDEFVPRH